MEELEVMKMQAAITALTRIDAILLEIVGRYEVEHIYHKEIREIRLLIDAIDREYGGLPVLSFDKDGIAKLAIISFYEQCYGDA